MIIIIIIFLFIIIRIIFYYYYFLVVVENITDYDNNCSSFVICMPDYTHAL